MVSCIFQATLKLRILLSDSSRLRLQAYPTVPSYIPSLNYFVLELHFWDLTSALFVCFPNRWLLPGYVEVIPAIDKFFITVCICVSVCVMFKHILSQARAHIGTHIHVHYVCEFRCSHVTVHILVPVAAFYFDRLLRASLESLGFPMLELYIQFICVF